MSLSTKNAVPPATPAAFLWFVTKPFWPAALTVVFLVAFSALLSQSQSLIFKWIVEAVEQHNVPQAFWYGLSYPVFIFAAHMVMRLSSVIAGLFWFPKARKYTNDVLVHYTMDHSQSYFADRFAGALLTKVNNVLGGVESLLFDAVWSYLSLVVSLVISLYFIATVDVLSAGIFGTLVILIVICNRFLLSKKRVLSREAAAAGSVMRGATVDVFSNMAAVRQFSAISKEKVRTSALSTSWADLQQKSWLYSDFTQGLNATILFVCLGGMFYWLVGRWEAGDITSSEFVFVLALVSQLTGSLVFIGRMMVNAARVAGEMEEGLKEIVVPHDIVDAKNAEPLTVHRGEVEFSHVTFTYNDTPVFADFSLHVAAGQRLGLVGHSGAGKSTLVSMLLRQLEIDSGVVAIDGQNISAVTQDSLRQAVAVVPQEPALFHRSIRENIAYGKDDATMSEIEHVARLAQAHDFIMALPQGYDTLVGERGVKLSGGQKQRIAIARAMLKNAPILILDEATSALDSESEVEIQKALHILMTGKTVIAIAHRLSTLREMDRIVVLDTGRITEDGTHETLKSYGGVYSRLWDHQAGGFLLE